MDNVVIREACGQDIPSILELLYDLGRPKPPSGSDGNYFGDLITKYVEDSDKEIFVATSDAKIIGMISMMYLPRLNRTSLEMYVPELIVLKKCQGCGIGKKLVDSCIAAAKEKKCHRIRLESGNQRIDSHQFYKNLGFEQYALSFTLDLDQK